MKNSSIVSFVLLFIHLTNHSSAQWQQTSITSGSVDNIASNSAALYANNGGLKYSTDNGNSWISMNYILLRALTANETAVFAAGSYPSQVSRTTNLGQNWTHNLVSAADGVFSLHASGINVYAGTNHYGLRKSKNNGETWGVVTFPFGTVNSVFAAGSNVYTALENWGLSVSTNNGNNWSAARLEDEFITVVHSNGTFVFAGSQTGGVFLSSDNGSNWSQSSLNSIKVTSITTSGNIIFAASTNSGVYFSANNGSNWQQVNTGLTDLNIRALHIYGDYIYAGTNTAGLWKRNLSELTNIELISSEIPSELKLRQNYPNPFNPVTNIIFNIPRESDVKIILFNSAGKQVSEILNSSLAAGEYTKEFNAAELPSGIYFCKMSAGNYTQVIKMVLVK